MDDEGHTLFLLCIRISSSPASICWEWAGTSEQCRLSKHKAVLPSSPTACVLPRASVSGPFFLKTLFCWDWTFHGGSRRHYNSQHASRGPALGGGERPGSVAAREGLSRGFRCRHPLLKAFG